LIFIENKRRNIMGADRSRKAAKMFKPVSIYIHNIKQFVFVHTSGTLSALDIPA